MLGCKLCRPFMAIFLGQRAKIQELLRTFILRVVGLPVSTKIHDGQPKV